jgi:hypothetical protein
MFKRIMVLAVMIGLLFVISTSKSAKASGYCGCSMACSGGSKVCQLDCSGDNFWDIYAAAAACCAQAQQNTPLECQAN